MRVVPTNQMVKLMSNRMRTMLGAVMLMRQTLMTMEQPIMETVMQMLGTVRTSFFIFLISRYKGQIMKLKHLHERVLFQLWNGIFMLVRPGTISRMQFLT